MAMRVSAYFPALLWLLLLCACGGGSTGDPTGPDGPGNGTSPTVESIVILDGEMNALPSTTIQGSSGQGIGLCGQARDAAGNQVPVGLSVTSSNPQAARIDFAYGLGSITCIHIDVGTGAPATITFSHTANGRTVSASVTIVPSF